MKILTTTNLTITKKLYTADYIESYSDGMPLSTTHNEYESAEERLKDLSKDYDKSELDIDTSEDVQDIGWEFGVCRVRLPIFINVAWPLMLLTFSSLFEEA